VGATIALRAWLHARRRAHATGAEVHTPEVRRSLRPVCDDIRQRGARVEQLIVLLKELWGTLPPDEDGDARSTGYRDGRREVLDGIVRVCIEEFYAADTDRPAWPDAGAASDGSARRP